MATLGTYYFDTASFGSATTIYDDANLTIVSANGFYSDSSIVREQVGGVLYAGQSCSAPIPTPPPVPPTPPTPPTPPPPTPPPTPPTPPTPPPTPPTPPTPTPTPPPTPANQYRIRNCTTGVEENVSLPQAVSNGSSIQWQSVCWEIVGSPTGTTQAISPQNYYTDCADCQGPPPSPPTPPPTPTPTPTPPPPQGYVLYGQYSSSSVCSGSYVSIYLDSPSFASATVAYTNANFNTLHPSGYFTVGGQYRQWTGSSFVTPPINCYS